MNSMPTSKQCDGRRKKKSKLKSFNLEDREACSLEDDHVRTVKIKKRKPSTETEETPGSAPVLKVRKIPSEPEKKSKGPKVEEYTEKKRKKRKQKKCKPEEPAQDLSGSSGAEQKEEDEDAEEALSPEERRALERKMKKMRKQEEKRKLKAEGKDVEKVEATKPSAGQLALDYLTCWSEKREDWKFQKTRQTWLLQHMFDREKVPDGSFSTLLPYLEGLQGVARDTTVQKAEALVRELEGEGAEGQEAQLRAHRAREVIQMLS
ncbi:uncharacterized protein C7orf50 homolog isoform X1 [Conger conger]|uniref:uncharacterized protein C7orf50 homolog isoform X1 n=2 Tax=Conger conger TaxID=82655 RepID=UPI002A59C05C|nr:uncharacterized protein C7orf50 homolog isoform X1 [Conger conger]